MRRAIPCSEVLLALHVGPAGKDPVALEAPEGSAGIPTPFRLPLEFTEHVATMWLELLHPALQESKGPVALLSLSLIHI